MSDEQRIFVTPEQVAKLQASVDGAYRERNLCVAALSKVYPSHLERHPADEPWEDDWRWIVFVELPTGQASWHMHDSHLEYFKHLKEWPGHGWDGHTTEEKYRRLAAIKAWDAVS